MPLLLPARRLLSLGLMLISVLAAPIAAAETITVGGVGALSPLLRYLGEEFAKKNPGLEVVVTHPPLGTVGGLRALAAGRIDIALAGRELRHDEAGQAKPWLQTPLVLATAGGRTQGLSSVQVADIFVGRKKTWDDGKPIRIVLRSAHDSVTQALRSMAPEIDAAVDEALKRADLPVAENDIEAVEMLARIPGSFGPTTLGLMTAGRFRLQPVAINGHLPSINSLADGSYPWRRRFYLVTRNSPPPAAAAFVAYLNSATAMALARQRDYLPAGTDADR